MPKKDLNKQYEKKHLQGIVQKQKLVKGAYLNAIEEVFESAGGLKGKEGKPFKLSDYPALNKRVENALAKFNQDVTVILVDGAKEQWNLADEKNDELFKNHLDGKRIRKQIRDNLFQRNEKALDQFLNQKTKGLGLSDRVWKYTNQFQSEIEKNLYDGIKSGRSAAAMARDQKQYLQQPDRLFRRVRDAKGNLKLSKAAQQYKPGRGIYRSSYKNAMRLTRDINNDAYRTSDNVRWANTKFILGYEVKLSNNHPKRDICDDLKGKYPKEFIWKKWHIQCLCYAVPILPDMDQYDEYEDAVLAGKGDDFKFKGEVETVPKSFTDYIDTNKDALNRLSTPPAWVKDNFVKGDLNNGLKITTKAVSDPVAEVSKRIDLKRYIKGDIPTNQEVSNILKEVANVKPEFFRNGLAGVTMRDTNSYMMMHSMSYSPASGKWVGPSRLSISTNTFRSIGFNPAQEFKDALSSLKTGTALTFNQEYAMESMWHEILHARTLTPPKSLSVAQTKSMETLNQFTARHTYDELLDVFGAKPLHQEQILNEGFGYREWVNDFRDKLKSFGIDEKQAVKDLFPVLMSDYSKIGPEISNYLAKYLK